jgi:hypothetical protein
MGRPLRFPIPSRHYNDPAHVFIGCGSSPEIDEQPRKQSYFGRTLRLPLANVTKKDETRQATAGRLSFDR